MSEYQYYELVAVDRQLSKEEMGYLRGISSRAQISSTRFCNTYNYGDLKADPRQLLSRFFDAYVYVSNFGCKIFAIKVPRHLIDESTLLRYLLGDICTYKSSGAHWIIEFVYEDEDGYDDEWDEGDGWMGSLLNIRSELMHGDYRSLYLAWLSQLDELEPDALSPAIPPGLDDLSASQSALCDFLKLDTQRVVAAAQVKSDYVTVQPEVLIDQYVMQLPEATARAQLKALLLDETGTARREQFAALVDKAQEIPRSSSVTVGHLLASARELRKKADEKAMMQKQLQQQQKAESVAANEEAYWRRVEELFEQRGSSTVYSELSTKLGDLQLMAKMLNRQTAYDQKLAELKQRYAKKTSHWQGLRYR
ncbi:hypothetical protein ACTL6P_19440 [Endozoicomonas acroporae]|uniref:hypothetical protein n=1 Tax=Endozoicomonas acroporae TaxID=1701104 RepID=UPI000C789D5B|nr:hypothetical protein [Endozoicomonas acroporae]